MGAGFDAEFEVAVADVLHELMAADDHACRMVAFESPHRTEPRFEPAVITLDAVVGVLLRVVKLVRHERFDRGSKRGCAIGYDLVGSAMRAERCTERRAARRSRRVETTHR